MANIGTFFVVALMVLAIAGPTFARVYRLAPAYSDGSDLNTTNTNTSQSSQLKQSDDEIKMNTSLTKLPDPSYDNTTPTLTHNLSKDQKTSKSRSLRLNYYDVLKKEDEDNEKLVLMKQKSAPETTLKYDDVNFPYGDLNLRRSSVINENIFNSEQFLNENTNFPFEKLKTQNSSEISRTYLPEFHTDREIESDNLGEIPGKLQRSPAAQNKTHVQRDRHLNTRLKIQTTTERSSHQEINNPSSTHIMNISKYQNGIPSTSITPEPHETTTKPHHQENTPIKSPRNFTKPPYYVTSRQPQNSHNRPDNPLSPRPPVMQNTERFRPSKPFDPNHTPFLPNSNQNRNEEQAVQIKNTSNSISYFKHDPHAPIGPFKPPAGLIYRNKELPKNFTYEVYDNSGYEDSSSTYQHVLNPNGQKYLIPVATSKRDKLTALVNANRNAQLQSEQNKPANSTKIRSEQGESSKRDPSKYFGNPAMNDNKNKQNGQNLEIVSTSAKVKPSYQHSNVDGVQYRKPSQNIHSGSVSYPYLSKFTSGYKNQLTNTRVPQYQAVSSSSSFSGFPIGHPNQFFHQTPGESHGKPTSQFYPELSSNGHVLSSLSGKPLMHSYPGSLSSGHFSSGLSSKPHSYPGSLSSSHFPSGVSSKPSSHSYPGMLHGGHFPSGSATKPALHSYPGTLHSSHYPSGLSSKPTLHSYPDILTKDNFPFRQSANPGSQYHPGKVSSAHLSQASSSNSVLHTPYPGISSNGHFSSGSQSVGSQVVDGHIKVGAPSSAQSFPAILQHGLPSRFNSNKPSQRPYAPYRISSTLQVRGASAKHPTFSHSLSSSASSKTPIYAQPPTLTSSTDNTRHFPKTISIPSSENSQHIRSPSTVYQVKSSDSSSNQNVTNPPSKTSGPVRYQHQASEPNVGLSAILSTGFRRPLSTSASDTESNYYVPTENLVDRPSQPGPPYEDGEEISNYKKNKSNANPSESSNPDEEDEEDDEEEMSDIPSSGQIPYNPYEQSRPSSYDAPLNPNYNNYSPQSPTQSQSSPNQPQPEEASNYEFSRPQTVASHPSLSETTSSTHEVPRNHESQRHRPEPAYPSNTELESGHPAHPSSPNYEYSKPHSVPSYAQHPSVHAQYPSLSGYETPNTQETNQQYSETDPSSVHDILNATPLPSYGAPKRRPPHSSSIPGTSYGIPIHEPHPAHPHISYGPPETSHGSSFGPGYSQRGEGHKGSTGPVHTFVKTDKEGNFQWGVRHKVGSQYAGR